MSRQRRKKYHQKTCVEKGADYGGNSETFEKISLEWLKLMETQLKPSSIVKYTNTLYSYLIPTFGALRLQQINRESVILFTQELLKNGGKKAKGLSPGTVNNIISVMNNVFQYASREKNLIVADIKNLNLKSPQKQICVLTQNEQRKLTGYLCKNISPSNLGILLCLFTGLRIGEICALKWKDINLEEQYIYVHHTMQRIQKLQPDGRKTQIMILKPKSDCSIRKVPIADGIMPFLKISQKSPETYILTGSSEKYIEPRCMENHFKTATKACGIKHINFHVLRHTFATRCIELEFDLKSLSEILGHASVNITLNRYVHPSMELKQENINKLSGFID